MTASKAPEVCLDDFVDPSDVLALVQRAMREDMGDEGIDVTSKLMGFTGQAGAAVVRAREPGRLCGASILPVVAEIYDKANLSVEVWIRDGQPLEAGSVIARLSGSMPSILAAERVALNFLTHLSGIATLTHRFVKAVAGTRVVICDTRKTIPGLRRLARHAVVCGGGTSHRSGLHDAVLVKDNHLAKVPLKAITKVLVEAISQARCLQPAVKFFEVEVDRIEQLKLVLAARPDIVLLDNMAHEQLCEAVSVRDRLEPSVLLEASGRIALEDVADVAATGVDRISVGMITHSARALDLGLDSE